jgi:hypothetical protein
MTNKVLGREGKPWICDMAAAATKTNQFMKTISFRFQRFVMGGG